MAPNKITDAERTGDIRSLRDALDNFRKLENKNDMTKYERSGVVDPYYIKDRAERKLYSIEQYQNALKKACDDQDAGEIQRLIKRIEESDTRRFLQNDIREAQKVYDTLTARKLKMPILAMDKKTMTELKHYSNPSPVVHRVMQAALLLLGVDEGRTSTWTHCQALCNPDGPNGLNRKLMQFDAEKVDPFIIDRVEILLRDIPLTAIQRASPGAATFYVWAQGVLTGLKKQKEENNNNIDEEDGFKLDEEEEYVPPLTARTMEGRSPQAIAKIIAEERKILSIHSTPKKKQEKPRHNEYRFGQM